MRVNNKNRPCVFLKSGIACNRTTGEQIPAEMVAELQTRTTQRHAVIYILLKREGKLPVKKSRRYFDRTYDFIQG